MRLPLFRQPAVRSGVQLLLETPSQRIYRHGAFPCQFLHVLHLGQSQCDFFPERAAPMKDYNMELRILDEPLMTVGLGVAFAKDDTRGICQKLEQTLADMKEDGTAAKIIGKYLDDPEKYLEVDKIGEE